MKLLVLAAFVILCVFVFADKFEHRVSGQSARAVERSPIVVLGERLFGDARFSTAKGDLPARCTDCHLYDEDPQGMRAYADFFNRSWVSSRMEDQRRLGLRNAPTIFDAGEMPRLHFDGEFASLEALVKGTISGRPLGWMPGEEAEAFAQARAVLVNDKNPSPDGDYRTHFKRAFSVDIEKLSTEQVVDLISKSVAEFCRTLKTRKDSPYDKFVLQNGLNTGPSSNESGKAFGERLVTLVTQLESKGSLKLSTDFGPDAVKGLKIFFSASRGNCVTCHTPPQFTDHSFRNLGLSQREYDKFHGEGSFAQLPIPSAAQARRPSTQFRETPLKNKPGIVDLGFWNFVDLKTSTLRRAGETDDRFLERMIATFKTPTLRNLTYTHPYFHDGSLTTLEEALEEIRVLSELARAGRVRHADEELVRIRFDAADIPALVAFLNSLNEDMPKLAYRNRP